MTVTMIQGNTVLTPPTRSAKRAAMKTLLPAAAAFLVLAACGQQTPEVVDSNPDPMATTLANAAPVELPPAIVADVTFRCSDNSLLYVTFFQGDTQASVRTEPTGTTTRLTAPAAGQPLTADGWSLTGDPENVTVTQPGKSSLTCHV